eukprot:TRINITY_DN1346_c0_g1_i2.p1 TRINITY_DN1346_c0_g1~~TRINITY_DN1346_c0_g1_i2.p1  ORF type:complete len:665 (+),score=179.18 TRINITY_DN1346_c0_g1_i2:96-1997(+)
MSSDPAPSEDYSDHTSEDDYSGGDYSGDDAGLAAGLGYGGSKRDQFEAYRAVLAAAAELEARDTCLAALFQALGHAFQQPLFRGALSHSLFSYLAVGPTVPLLIDLLRTTSMGEVAKRTRLYLPLIELLQQWVAHPDLIILLRPDHTSIELACLSPSSRPSVLVLLHKLKKSADIFAKAHAQQQKLHQHKKGKAKKAPYEENKHAEPVEEEEEEDKEELERALAIVEAVRIIHHVASIEAKSFLLARLPTTAMVLDDEVKAASPVEELVVQTQALSISDSEENLELKEAREAQLVQDVKENQDGAEEPQVVDNAQLATYLENFALAQQMKPQVSVLEANDGDLRRQAQELLQSLQFQTMDLLGDDANLPHYFRTYVQRDANATFARGRLGRIRQEVSSLMDHLPEGIYVRVDDDRFDFMRVLMQGPVDTPYMNGLFLFDVYLPPEYPQKPPKVQFMTTGNSTFRFNPNLYTDGKVCLSLLGTWDGPGWDPNISTLLQVFVSIQAMILTDTPIVNEPGWEHYHTDPHSRWREHIYNQALRHGTLLYATLWHLRQPLPGFQEVIQTHFWLKRHQILWQILDWKAFDPRLVKRKYVSSYQNEVGDWRYEDSEVSQLSFAQTCEELQKLLPSLAFSA